MAGEGAVQGVAVLGLILVLGGFALSIFEFLSLPANLPLQIEQLLILVLLQQHHGISFGFLDALHTDGAESLLVLLGKSFKVAGAVVRVGSLLFKDG